MHIPDGYLSPATCGAFYAVMLPLWYRATKRVKKIVKSQYVPLIAVGAAFSFLVMMFNIPVPDGTTAHAVGAVMIAIVLGPWAAVIAVSIALGDPSAVLRRRRRARAGCEQLQHGLRDAVRGVRRLPAAHAEHVPHVVAPRHHGRRGRLRRDRRGCPLRGDRVRTAARAVPHGERNARSTRRSTCPRRSRRCCSRISRWPVSRSSSVASAWSPTSSERTSPSCASTIRTCRSRTRRCERKKPLNWKHALLFFGVMVALTPIGLLAPGGAFGEDCADGPRPREIPSERRA